MDLFGKGAIQIPKRNPDDIVIPRLSDRDKKSLFILAISFVYERLIIKGGWQCENHHKMNEEDFVWVDIDENQQKEPLKKKLFKIIKHEKKEKTFREMMKEGPQAIKMHKTELPSVTKILYPHLAKTSHPQSNPNKN